MTPREWVEIIAAITGPLGVVGLLFHRVYGGYGIGARAIQFAVAVLLIPAILILGLEKVLDGATLGTLIAGIVGYVLWKVGEYIPDKKDRKTKADPPMTDCKDPEPSDD